MLNDDYYTVPIDEELLWNAGFRKDEYGRYERVVFRDDEFFQVISCCPKCGNKIVTYDEVILNNGTMQIRYICPAEGCIGGSVKQCQAAKDFAREVRNARDRQR